MPDEAPPSQRTEVRTRYFSRLSVSKARTFASGTFLDLCFPDGRLAQWTVLLGENGTGKTTLLQYIASLQPEGGKIIENEESVGGKARPRLSPIGLSPNWFNWHAENLSRPWIRGEEQLEISLRLTSPVSSLGEIGRQQIELPEPRALRSSPFDYGYKLEFKQDEENRAKITANYTIPIDLGFHEEFFLVGYGATRHVAGPTSPYLSSNASSQLFAPLNTLFNEDQPLVSPEQWLLGLDHASKSDKANPRPGELLLRAVECLCSVLPGISRIEIKPFSIIEDVNGSNSPMSVVFKTPYASVRFGSLSLGYRAMAAWIIDLLRRMSLRYPYLENPAAGAAVVLIDEFDLHMHPQWQMHAMSHLSRHFPNTQFIVTAHSPIIVQAANGNANLALLRKFHDSNGERVVIDNDPVQVKGWRLDQLVTSDLFNLPSSRSSLYAQLFERRRDLLRKESLSVEEQVELSILTRRLEVEAPPEISVADTWLKSQLSLPDR